MNHKQKTALVVGLCVFALAWVLGPRGDSWWISDPIADAPLPLHWEAMLGHWFVICVLTGGALAVLSGKNSQPS